MSLPACLLGCLGGWQARPHPSLDPATSLPSLHFRLARSLLSSLLLTPAIATTPPLLCCAAVLLGSSVLEAYSLRMAYQMIQQSAEEADMTVWQYIKRGRDPTTVGELVPGRRKRRSYQL